MSKFDVYEEGGATPFVTDVSLEEGERVEAALNAIDTIRKDLSLTPNMRRNPADIEDLDLDQIDALIADQIGQVPERKNQAISILKEKGMHRAIGEVSKLYDARFKQQIVMLASNIAQSLEEDVLKQFKVLIDSGVASQLIAARYKRFEGYLPQCRTVQFSDLTQKEQDYITALVRACDAFFDVSDLDAISNFNASDFARILVRFKSDKLVQRIMTIIGNVEYQERTDSHYAAPFLYAVYIATEIDDDIDSWMKDSEEKRLISPFQLFPAQDNLVLTSSTCKELCQAMQVNSILEPALKLSILFYLGKEDGPSFFESDMIMTMLVSNQIISKDRAKTLTNKMLQIAYFAMMISGSPNYRDVIAFNYSTVKTSLKILNEIKPRLGVILPTDPILAYEYANVSNVNQFDNYMHWGEFLVASFYGRKSYDGYNFYNSAKATSELIISNSQFRKSVTDLILAMRKSKSCPVRRVNMADHPFNGDADFLATDFGSLGARATTTLTNEFIDWCEDQGFSSVIETLFPENTFFAGSATQHIISASLRVKSFEKPSKKELAWYNLSLPESDFEVYHSVKYNPLSMIIGHNDFWNCCLTVGREASNAAVASFYTDVYGAFVSFAFDQKTKDGEEYEVLCCTMTSFTKSLISGQNVNVPQDAGLDLIFGDTEINLLYVNPNLSKASKAFSKNPDAKDVELYLTGGSEAARYSVDDSLYEDSAKAVLSAIKVKKVADIAGANTRGAKPYMEAADAAVKYVLKPEYLDNTPYKESVADARYTKIENLARNAYAETRNATGTANALGLDFVASASNAFTEMHVLFNDIGSTVNVSYKTEKGEAFELDPIADWNYLLYMFSFPKGNNFVPFEGAVYFHTDADAGEVKELLIPSWFYGKPLKRGNRTLTTKDLIKMRTPKKGAFVLSSNGSTKKIL
jgi:hypothetical protein